ncbi:MAG: cation/H(+) antiporter [Myxococcales bacterium]|nr:cation/H(+) antiporter [Myxococcales bacterium]
MHGGLSPIALLLAQVAVVLLASRVLARAVRYLGQPTVIGEVLAGIVLGPSLLGHFWPDAMGMLFPQASLGGLALLAQLGLVFFMFLVGLEFDPKLLQGRGAHSVVISQASIAVPFAMGCALALPLHPEFAPEGVSFLPFALFLGAAMSITAFPVLARILAERGVLKTRIGAISLSCAALADVSAWCILAFVVSLARAEGILSGAVTTMLTAVFAAVIWFWARPLLRRLGPRGGQAIAPETVAIAFFLVLVAACTTEVIGIHALFGAFLLGAVMPRGSGLTEAITHKVEDFVLIVLLPLFFAYNGLRTDIASLATTQDWVVCATIIAVACLGKFGGSMLAARIVGLSWRESSAIGVLMNTRGLMELIVLNVGLDLGILSPRLFTMMVIMALVTTWITSPLLERIYPRRLMLADLDRPAPSSVLICVSDPALVPTLVRLGARLGGGMPLTALHVLRSDRPSTYLREGDESGPVVVLREAAAKQGVRVDPVTCVASDPARDIVRVATERGVRLILLGTHRPLWAEGELGGVVGRVLRDAPMDVGVLVDRGLHRVDNIELAAGADDPALTAAVAALSAPVATERGPGTLYLGLVGGEVPDGITALLLRPRR